MATRTFKCTWCKERFESSIEVIKSWTSRFHSKQCRLDYARASIKKAKEKQQARDKKNKAKELEKQKRKNKRESVSMLRKKLDWIFSEYIRRKYSDKKWTITCISCEKKIHWKESHNCHWISRGNKQYRFDEDNCRPWCAWCNTFNQEFHQRIFTIKQIKRLWQETVDIMIDNTNYVYKQGKTELRALIDEFTIKLNKIKWAN